MQQAKNSLTLQTWRGYVTVLARDAFDFELALAVEKEQANYGKKMKAIGFANISICEQGLDCAVSYCNKTGQPIGVNFVDDNAPSYTASIASQWLNTGPNALADHVKTTPIAYTVYLINKSLPSVQSVEDINERVSVLAGLYSVLADHGTSKETTNLISALQTALWINSKLGRVNVNHSFGAMYARNVLDMLTLCAVFNSDGLACNAINFKENFAKGLRMWVGNVLGRLIQKNMVDDLEWCENMVANAMRDVNAAVTNGRVSIDAGLTDVSAFSNLPQERKASQTGYAKNMKRKVETEAAANALGDIF